MITFKLFESYELYDCSERRPYDKGKKTEIELLEEISNKLSDMILLLKLSQRSALEIAKSRLLASELRAKMYNLCDGKHAVSDISKELNKPQPLVSRYLKDLEKGGLVKALRKGKRIFYSKIV